jgi:hypothetical protein
MQLKYHQATYDLLIQNRIDPSEILQEAAKELSVYPLESEWRRRAIASHRLRALHWQNFNLHLDSPHFSHINIERLNTLERRFSVVLPASVREWFSLNFVPDLMTFLKDITVLSIHKFRPFAANQYDETGRHDLWEFANGEFGDQDIYRVAFESGKSDDPPVFVERKTLDQYSPAFSDMIYLSCWDLIAETVFRYHFVIRDLTDYGAPSVLTLLPQHRISVSKLQEQYLERSGNFRTRFYNQTVRINLVHYRDYVTLGFFHAHDEGSLKTLIAELWGEDRPIFRTDDIVDINEISLKVLNELNHKRILHELALIDGWVSSDRLGKQLNYFGSGLLDHLKILVGKGDIEAHPDNEADAPQEQLYRLKPSSS